ncbi:phage baseplate protein [Faecalibacterium hominis (ex Afrizal et al. 2022)]|uniref:phage baseplate protein n=1 Tax=Faecalibacterium hominis (ex Afrizal et al. 2022) TaxID=2881265 RepID=UPI003C308E6F
MDFDAIITGIRKAIYGREVREYIASSMEWTRDFVNQSIANIKELLRQAEAARDAAKASQDAAKVSETNAKASENAARASQNAAASSASAAAGSASEAKTSETNAKASENAAKTSETNAKTSEANAKSSETKAATSEANAKTSETNAKASADSMGTSVATCTAKAKEAEASAGKAAASEGNAKTSEGNAKASEDEARQLVEAAKKVVNTDKTLTIDGAPADAKTVGDKFKSIKTDWNSVADKPSTFPPSEHNHSAANITSGILGLARGGTGCSTALDACKTLLWRGDMQRNQNWNNLETGVWMVVPESFGSNSPSGIYTYGAAIVFNIGGSCTQVYVAHNTGAMMFRQRFSSSNDFSGWARVSTGGTLSAYPVGAIYISTSSTSPASLFGGTWESIASERVLMGVSSSHGAGSTVSAGLPNIKGAVLNTWHGGDPSGSGALSVAVNGRSAVRNGDDGTFTWGNFYFDAASFNSIYGNASTVQPAAYYVYMWRRTA